MNRERVNRWKHISPSKLSVRKRKRLAEERSVFRCLHDGEVCSKPRKHFDEDLGKSVSVGACIRVFRDGKVHFCSRFKGKRPDPSFFEDLIRKAELEHSVGE
jgi:hypothetical protein